MVTKGLLSTPQTWLITGGAGFIGSHLVKKLVHLGQEVRILDNFSSGCRANLTEVEHKIQIITGDIRDKAAVRKAVFGVNYILHHAALISVAESIEKPLETMEINVQGTANILEEARRANVKRVVFASSSAVYGNGEQLPYHENSPTDCHSPYALSKEIGSALCQMYFRLYGLETVVLRYFNVFGGGQNPNSAYAAVIAKFMQLARQGAPLGIDWDGEQSRDFVHVTDVVQANLISALKAKPGEIYNVASGKTYSLLQLVDTIEKITGKTLQRVFRPKRAGDAKSSSADITKLRQQGYTPSVSLEEGLKQIWERQDSL